MLLLTGVGQQVFSQEKKSEYDFNRVMKKIILLVFFVFFTNTLIAQNASKKFNLQDSLKTINATSDPKTKAQIYFRTGQHYNYNKGDSAIFYYKEAEKIAKNNNLTLLLLFLNGSMSNQEYHVTGNYPLALYHAFETLRYAKIFENSPEGKEMSIKSRSSMYAGVYNNIAYSYAFLGNKAKALEYFDKMENLPERNKLSYGYFHGARQLHINLKEWDKAKYYNSKLIEMSKKDTTILQRSNFYMYYADILMHEKKYQSAASNYKIGINCALKTKLFKDALEGNLGAALAYKELNQTDSSIYHANNVNRLSENYIFTEGQLNANILLYNIYKKKGNKDSAFKYLENSDSLRRKMFDNAKANEAQNMAISEEDKQRELKEQEAEQQKILIFMAIAFLVLAIGIYLNGKRKQKNKIKKIEEDRKNKELQAAQDLQMSMLPKQLPQNADLDIAAFIRSSTEVGGDYYDFFEHKGKALYSICGDATGHGVASGMMVSVTKAGLNGIEALPANTILHKLNNIVKNIDLGTLRMSLNVVQIKSNEFELSSAAMPPVYHYVAATNYVEEILTVGLPLGGLREEHFDILKRSFNKGDIIVQLSDGLPEAPNLVGEMYDYERLRKLIEDNGKKSAQGMIDSLIASVDSWLQGQHNPDDITLVIIKKIND